MRFSYMVGVCALLAIGCKSAQKNSQKSLDSLAGNTTANVCSASGDQAFPERYETFWSQKSIVADQGYRDSLRPIFAAVPTEFQSWFFLKGGKVQLIGKASDYCSQISAQTKLFTNTGDVGGCVNFPKSGEFVGMPTIYVGVDAADYKTQMEQASLIVQGFGVVLSSFLTEIALTENLSANNELVYEYGAYDNEMRNLKSGLSFMVIEDLIRAKNDKGESLASTMPESFRKLIASTNVLDANVDRNTRWKNFWEKYNDPSVREFVNYTVSQVFETQWCSDTTREVLSTSQMFSDTGKYFRAEVLPVFSSVFSGQGGEQNSTETAPATGTTLTDGDVSDEIMSPTPSANEVKSLQLGGRLFPVLGAVVRAPFAVANYFQENRPVRSWFSNHQPVRRVLFGVARAVSTVGRGAAVVTGRVAGGVARFVGGGVERVGYRIQNGCLIRRWRC